MRVLPVAVVLLIASVATAAEKPATSGISIKDRADAIKRAGEQVADWNKLASHTGEQIALTDQVNDINLQRKRLATLPADQKLALRRRIYDKETDLAKSFLRFESLEKERKAKAAIAAANAKQDKSLGYGALAVGKSGELRADKLTVHQIVDDNNMLVEWETYRDTRSSVMGQQFGSFSVSNEIVWLKQSTAGLVDGKGFVASGEYKVTGTKRYDTASGGSKTVFVLEPVNATKGN